MAGGGALARLGGISKSFGGVRAVDDVSLDIPRGEMFALLGPSGCGKTTLMRMIAGFEAPDGGSIVIDGQDMRAVPPWRRPVNMMFQSYALFPHMSVAANVGFGLRRMGLGRAEIDSRVAGLLSLVQLDGFGARRPDALSGGQRQRVALARALARRPKLLLLDEPLAALDRQLRETTRFELMELQARAGVTFVMVTHDQDEAMAMASRIAVMRAGRLAQVGSPADVYERPASDFVAGFLGEVNWLTARLTSADASGLRLATADGEWIAAPRPGLDPGARLRVGVRPERLRLSDGGGLEATLIDQVYLGHRVLARARLGSGALLRLAAEPHALDGLRPGARVTLSASPEALMLFPERDDG